MKNIDIIDNSLIDINQIGKYDKFINIITLRSDDNKIVEYRNDGVFFKSSNLSCDKISDTDKLKSLINMRNALVKHINNEIEKKLLMIKSKLQKKYEKKYMLNELNKRIYKE